MADYVRAGTCGACKEFEFEGSGKKGTADTIEPIT